MARAVVTGCGNDCGGKCPLLVYVEDQQVVKIASNQPIAERLGTSPCIRGLQQYKRLHHPDRLRHPLERRGPRGGGDFQRISWDRALEIVAKGLEKVKKEYGNAAILNLSRSGAYTAMLHDTMQLTRRFLNLFGGCTDLAGGYSLEAAAAASIYTYGTDRTDHSREDLLNSRLIILWGWNPVETLFGSHTIRYLKEAKRRGAKMVCVDPRCTPSASMADQWIPIRPGTDVAMISALAHIIIVEDLLDRDFIAKCVLGFDEYRRYILGEEDHLPKTPEWAEGITGVHAQVIKALARDYAQMKPAALMPGWGPQRIAYGENFTRATATLASMTGNIGIPGGNPAGANLGPGVSDSPFPTSFNPTGIRVPVYLWADLMLRGRGGGYPSDIKAAYSAGGNLLNQQANINKTLRALKGLEFFVVHEQFMTPTARFADVILPVCTWMERDDILFPWSGYGDFLLYQNRVMEPMYECKTDLEVFTLLAERLGFRPRYNPYDKDEEWLREFAKGLGVPDFEEFKRVGVHIYGNPPKVAFREQIEGGKPFPTPSGKIEVYSPRLAEMNNPLIPPIAKYVEGWEGVGSPEAEKYPLQLITPHHRFRINSTFYGIPLTKTVEESLWINPVDAEVRQIRDGEDVRVFNERGSTVVRAEVTDKILPGVVSLCMGAWYTPDAEGNDRAGSANMLTTDRATPLAKGATQHNALVQVSPLKATP